MNEALNQFYKTKFLSALGRRILLYLVVIAIIGYLIIPEPKPSSFINQAFSLKGINIKNLDEPHLSDFISSIKRNNGILFLGTSESTSLGGLNYYHFLNDDTVIERNFSVLAGAGRTCGVYIPIIDQKKELFKNLELVYFINPVYWRNDLSKLNLKYWNRYLASPLIAKSNQYESVSEYIEKENTLTRLTNNLSYYLRSIQFKFSSHLRTLVSKKQYKSNFSFVPPSNGVLEQKYQTNFKKDDYNIDYQVLKSFKNYTWFNPVNTESDYRYQELKDFVAVCQKAGVKLSFIIGPYNKGFIKTYQPNAEAGYQEVVEKLKILLKTEKVEFFDFSYLSDTTLAFNDHQHHSPKAAFLMYQKLKNHYVE